MQTQARLRTLAGIVLAWYMLFLGASLATASAQGGPFTMVCSADGQVRWMPVQDDGQAVAHDGMDCPLCAGAFVPPPPAQTRDFARPFAAPAGVRRDAGPLHVPTASPPLPSRGPPRFPHA